MVPLAHPKPALPRSVCLEPPGHRPRAGPLGTRTGQIRGEWRRTKDRTGTSRTRLGSGGGGWEGTSLGGWRRKAGKERQGPRRSPVHSSQSQSVPPVGFYREIPKTFKQIQPFLYTKSKIPVLQMQAGKNIPRRTTSLSGTKPNPADCPALPGSPLPKASLWGWARARGRRLVMAKLPRQGLPKSGLPLCAPPPRHSVF